LNHSMRHFQNKILMQEVMMNHSMEILQIMHIGATDYTASFYGGITNHAYWCS
jgi:hypothetical protein